MFEITRLINHVIGGSDSKKKEIVEKLGYKEDMYRGYSRLRGLMQTGKCDSEIRENLPQALGIDKKFVHEAFVKTDKKLDKQKDIHSSNRRKLERKRFRPYLWLEHEYDHIISKSYMNSPHYNDIKRVELPEFISSLKWEDQLKVIRRYINMNLNRPKDKRFGEVRNYIYFKDADQSYLFDAYGGHMTTDNVVQRDLLFAAS